MNDFRVDIERRLNQLGSDIRRAVERIIPLEEEGHGFKPACDILESDEAYKIMLDLPGLSKDEINISLKDHVLTVKGERAVPHDESQIYRRQERSAGIFSRSFALPENSVTENLKAQQHNGTLIVSVPKTGEHEDATSIPID